MKKKVLIVLGVIILIVVALIAYAVIDDLQQEKKLIGELVEINELSNAETIDMDKINEHLNKTVTKGDYAVVEQAYKQYLKDSFDNSLEIANLINDERIVTILTAENYIEDGPDFIETKAYIAETKQSLEDCKNKYYEFFTDEKAMSYINDKNLDSYYIDFYKSDIAFDMELGAEDKTVENAINDIIAILDSSEDVIDFLIENANNWQIIEDSIVFNSDTLSQQYDELIQKMPIYQA